LIYGAGRRQDEENFNMAIFVDDSTKVVVQGITGRDGGFHTGEMLAYGTKVLAGVTPGRGGQKFQDKVPVYDTVKEAVSEHGVNTSVIFVPPFGAAGAIYEAADAGCKLIVCITEGVPTVDMVKVMPYLAERGVRLIGPNCPGLLAPGIAKLGILPTSIVQEGPVGLVSRSGTLTYEVVYQLTAAGLGQTTCLGIGGDPVIGTTFMDAIKAFNEDPKTEAFVMIGEIGGDAEEQAAEYIQAHVKKPVVSFIAGQTAPPGKRMGHAGAIVSGGTGTAAEKKVALEAAGIPVADRPMDIVPRLQEIWKK
jgi:succinyl-CoA synthetase alpha subunit